MSSSSFEWFEESGGNGCFTDDGELPTALELPVPSPTPVTAASTSSDGSLSTTTDKTISEPTAADIAKLKENEKDEVAELIPDTRWPGTWISPQPDIFIDYESNQLYDILQSAKMILTGDSERPIQRANKLRSKNDQAKVSLSVSLPSEQVTGGRSPSPEVKQKHRLRPKTSCSSPALSHNKQNKQKKNLSSANYLKKSQVQGSPFHKYKPPDMSKVKRKYWQPWNETGELRKKNTQYLEVHYDDCLPVEEDEGLRLVPTRYTHNYKHGHHWELRYLVEEEKPKPKLKKVERVWENEFQMFKLNKQMDQQLKLNDS